MKNIFVLLGSAALLSGCLADRGEKVFLRSYVLNYIDFENIDLIPSYVESSDHPDVLTIYVDLMKSGNRFVEGSYNSRSETSFAYDALCEKHGDTTFDREIRIAPHNLIPTFSAVDYVSIGITSDADYDAGHPAGTSLNDLMTIDTIRQNRI